MATRLRYCQTAAWAITLSLERLTTLTKALLNVGDWEPKWFKIRLFFYAALLPFKRVPSTNSFSKFLYLFSFLSLLPLLPQSALDIYTTPLASYTISS